MKSLVTIVDDIDRQVLFVVFSRVLGISVQIGGGLLAVSGIKALNFPYILVEVFNVELHFQEITFNEDITRICQ